MNIGIDLGFYATKAVTAGKDPVHFVSAAAPPADSMLSMNGHTNVVVSSVFGTHLTGEEAVKFDPGDTRQEFSDWVNTNQYMQLFYGALGRLTDASQFSVNLGVGLPIADYGRYKDTLGARLLGRHEFTLLGIEGRHQQVAKVEVVRVIPQGWGAVLCVLFDDGGRVVNPDVSRQRVAVLDIGGRTVNYLSVDGLADIPAESRGTRRGAWNVVRKLRLFLKDYYPDLAELADYRLMQAVMEREIYNGDERVDLAPVVNPELEDIGAEIVNTARQYWGNTAATFRKVLVIGGGAYLWGDAVKRAFPQAAVLPAPEFANARGYYRYVTAKARG